MLSAVAEVCHDPKPRHQSCGTGQIEWIEQQKRLQAGGSLTARWHHMYVLICLNDLKSSSCILKAINGARKIAGFWGQLKSIGMLDFHPLGNRARTRNLKPVWPQKRNCAGQSAWSKNFQDTTAIDHDLLYLFFQGFVAASHRYGLARNRKYTFCLIHIQKQTRYMSTYLYIIFQISYVIIKKAKSLSISETGATADLVLKALSHPIPPGDKKRERFRWFLAKFLLNLWWISGESIVFWLVKMGGFRFVVTGYPQLSSMKRVGIFPNINHPAMRVAPWLWKPTK